MKKLDSIERSLKNKFDKLHKKFEFQVKLDDSFDLKTSIISRKIIKTAKILDKKLNNLTFEIDEKLVYPSKIGKLNCALKFKRLLSSSLNQFYNSDIKYVDLSNDIVSCIRSIDLFSNEEIMVIDNANIIWLLDSKYSIIDYLKLDSRLYITSMCSDCTIGNIYLCDTIKCQIFVKHFFNNQLIKTFGNFGYSKYEFNYPCSVCIYENSLYVLDQRSRRIQKYSLECLFQKIYPLFSSKASRRSLIEYPSKMSISNDLIAVSDCNTSKIYIYNLDGVLMHVIEDLRNGIYSFVCAHDYIFIHGRYGSLICYDLNKIKQNLNNIQPEFERYESKIDKESSSILFFNDNLVFQFKKTSYLAII